MKCSKHPVGLQQLNTFQTSIEAQISELNDQLQQHQQRLDNLSADVVVLGKPVIQNTAAQVLLTAYGAQPKPHNHAKRCTNQIRSRRIQLGHFLNSFSAPKPDLVAFAKQLDGIVEYRDLAPRYGNVAQLQREVNEALQMAARHPQLEVDCKSELFVLRHFAQLRAAFKFRGMTSHSC